MLCTCIRCIHYDIYVIMGCLSISADNPQSIGVTLGDVLAFITGLRDVPPIGFEKAIAVEFFDGERLPNASTCSLVIRLPRQLIDAEVFREKIVFSILGVCGFGNV